MTDDVPFEFDMRITREQAIFLLAAGLSETRFWSLMCKEYGDDDDWVGLADSDLDSVREDPVYQTFGLWFNKASLQELWAGESLKGGA